MKLKYDFIIQEVCDTPMALSREFEGVVRLNESSRFIFEQLRDDTTESEILDRLSARYDVPREQLAADLSEVLTAWRVAGILVD